MRDIKSGDASDNKTNQLTGPVVYCSIACLFLMLLFDISQSPSPQKPNARVSVLFGELPSSAEGGGGGT